MRRTPAARRRARNLGLSSLPPDKSAERWDEWSIGGLNSEHPVKWLAERWNYEQPLYRELARVTPPGGKILEIGTGAGPNTLWMAMAGYETLGIEYRPALVAEARKLAQQLGVGARYEEGDAFDLSAYRGFDTVFSVGMVEHWSYTQSVAAIRQQAACARTVVVDVPTAYIRHAAPVTDERFYSRPEMRGMLKDAGLSDVRVFGYGDVVGPIGRVSRALVPDIPYRLVCQRYLPWPCAAFVAVGRSGGSS